MKEKILKWFSADNYVKWILGSTCVEIILIFCFYINHHIIAGSVSMIIYMIFLMACSGIAIGQPVFAAFNKTRYFDEEEWELLEYQKRHYSDSSGQCLRRVRVINYLYRDGGEIDRLVQSGEALKLYKRLNHIDSNIELQGKVFELGFTTILPIMLTNILLVDDSNTVKYMFFLFFFVIIMMLLMFATIGVAHEPKEAIYLYEKEKLKEKIYQLHNSLSNLEETDMEILKMQQDINIYLMECIKKTRKKSKKISIEEDIRKLNELNLCISGEQDILLQRIELCTGEGMLAYKMVEEGKQKVLMPDYEVLKEILDRYNMIKSLLRCS
ncbi:MAG: hypothetical protein PUB19_08870 [Lachnospiraceae bacterium]|nr:hypothetical protein [Lachnospiraceae bacterium]